MNGKWTPVVSTFISNKIVLFSLLFILVVSGSAKCAEEEPPTSINNSSSSEIVLFDQGVTDKLLSILSDSDFRAVTWLLLIAGMVNFCIRGRILLFIIGVASLVFAFIAPTYFLRPHLLSRDIIDVLLVFILPTTLIALTFRYRANKYMRERSELPSIDELKERQEGESDSEQLDPQSRVISQPDADTGIEITKNKRKIVID